MSVTSRRKLFVGGLPGTVDEGKLQSAFGRFYSVEEGKWTVMDIFLWSALLVLSRICAWNAISPLKCVFVAEYFRDLRSNFDIRAVWVDDCGVGRRIRGQSLVSNGNKTSVWKDEIASWQIMHFTVESNYQLKRTLYYFSLHAVSAKTYRVVHSYPEILLSRKYLGKIRRKKTISKMKERHANWWSVRSAGPCDMGFSWSKILPTVVSELWLQALITCQRPFSSPESTLLGFRI